MISELGNITLILAILLQLAVTVIKLTKNKRFKDNYELFVKLHLVSTISIVASLFILIYAFLTHSYTIETVFQNSENTMSFIELLVATWAGREGVLLLWASLASIFTIYLLGYFRGSLNDRVIDRAISIQLIMNLFITTFNLAGGSTPFTTRASSSDGLGISPSLESFWQQIHPPLAFIAYSAFIFPYAVGIAGLIGIAKSEKTPDNVIIVARRFLMLGWACVNLLIIAGSIWAYEANWNGFWAWDPIEVASLVMWALVTLYFHSSTFVDTQHPLHLTSLTLGWVGVSFASFVVRSGLWSGFHGYVGIEKAIVFGSIFLLSLSVVVIAVRKANSVVIPEILYQIREKTPHVLTWWALLTIAIVNVIGLLVQLINGLALGNGEIPYEYYMALNGLAFLGLVLLFLACDIKRSISDIKVQAAVVILGAVISGIIFAKYLLSSPLVFLLSIIVGSVVITQGIGIVLNVRKGVESSRIRTQLIHFSIILMLLPYFAVDYGSHRVNLEVQPDETTDVPEFEISFILSKNFANTEEPYPVYELQVTDSLGRVHQLEIKQGQYKGEYWSRGTWLVEPGRDIYFMLLDANTGYIVDPQAPVDMQISEKPYANLFRISLIFQTLIALVIVGVITRPIKRDFKSELQISTPRDNSET